MRSIGLWVLICAASVGSVSSQTECEENLTQAQDLYISGAFTEVEAMLAPCLQPGQLSADNRVLAHRLLILSALQQGRLIEAKLVALALLNLQPEYEPDPAFDPPAYADLIATVRSQLEVRPPEERVDVDASRIPIRTVQPGPIPPLAARQPDIPFRPLEIEPPTPSRRPGAIELGYWAGVASFTGDFYRNGSLDDYLTSDGPRLGMQYAYVPASWVAIGLTLEGSYHPKFPAQRAIANEQAGIRTEALVGSATVEARLRAWSKARVSPSLSTGVGVVAARMLDETRYGVGPSVGLGVDVAASEGLSLFTEATAFFPLPEDAIDNSPRRHGDVFSGIRVGLRSRFGH
ncbi:MAG: hypothetical protein Rubg2KO_01350 [Rubricoccaceae bacterium]